MTVEPTAFLYPFIEAEERDTESLLADLTRSAAEKWRQSERLAAETVARYEAEILAAAAEMAARFRAGGRLFSFGNGGSATDANNVAQHFATPIDGLALPARSLAEAPSVVTALANDIGVAAIFSRQLIAHAGRDDIALGLSTSGGSENVLAAFAEARKRGMLTIGLSGYEGGRMASSPDIRHCFVARSDSVHRIQETQTAIVQALWSAVQQQMTQPTEEAAQ